MKTSIGKKFKKEVKDLEEYIVLATVKAKDYQKTNLEIIKQLTEEEKIPGVYVTLAKPFKTLQKIFSRTRVFNQSSC